MRITIPKSLGLAVATSACLALAALGQTTTTFTYENDALGQYTMPYTGYTSAANQTNGIIAQVLCDDYTDEVNSGQSWTAFVTDLSAIPDNPNTVYYGALANSAYTGTTLGNDPTITEQEEYMAAAILAIQITELNPLGGTPASELSDAVWDVFEPGSVSLDSTAQKDLNTALETAVTDATNNGANAGQDLEAATGKDITFYTPVYTAANGIQSVYTSTDPAPPGSPNGGRPQEFLTVTSLPEPSTWAVLGFDSFGAGIVGLYFLRRKSRIQS
jgi:hypothetical protein